MMADIDRIELLAQLANNERKDNDEWRREVWREGNRRAKRINDLIIKFEQEYAALDQERQLLSQYLPRQEEMPKVVTQGPRSNEPIQRKANP